MRVTADKSEGMRPESSKRWAAVRPASLYRPSAGDLIPLYDHEQFLFLVERERARADRAAARPRKAPRQQAAQDAALGSASVSDGSTKAGTSKAAAGGQPKPSSEGVWGATTDNREFSLVIFRPRARADRAGMVDLLQRCVRTTDAVGVVDARRLGVLLPDTAADNAIHFVKKVLSLATEQGVHLSHIVHTYPAAWPDEESPMWHEPKRSKEERQSSAEGSEASASVMPRALAQRQAVDRGMIGGLVDWLQSTAFRRPARREVRASA